MKLKKCGQAKSKPGLRKGLHAKSKNMSKRYQQMKSDTRLRVELSDGTGRIDPLHQLSADIGTLSASNMYLGFF